MDRRNAVRRVVKAIREFKPTTVLTHYENDRHGLHRGVSQVVTEGTWHAFQSYYEDLGKPWKAGGLYYFEVWDLFEKPNLLVDISEYMDRKVEAMKLYKSQVQEFPYVVDYLISLARVRGLPSGVKYAEAFLTSAAVQPVI